MMYRDEGGFRLVWGDAGGVQCLDEHLQWLMSGTDGSLITHFVERLYDDVSRIEALIKVVHNGEPTPHPACGRAMSYSADSLLKTFSF
jgi:hypothetical protein